MVAGATGGNIMTEKTLYRLDDLMAQFDPNAPMPKAVGEWDQATSGGLGQSLMSNQVDIRTAALVFREKLAD